MSDSDVGVVELTGGVRIAVARKQHPESRGAEHEVETFDILVRQIEAAVISDMASIS